jgi:hypothetical protein
VCGTPLSSDAAHADDGRRASGLGELERDQRVAHAAPNSRRERARQRAAERLDRGEQGADILDRPEDRVAPTEVHQAAHPAEDPRQDEDGVVQVLHQEVQAGQGVPEKQVFHSPADLVPVEEDVLRACHILLIQRRTAPFSGTLQNPVILALLRDL